ncbi:Protein draper [Holothuria leucospilota]|uniref:Protein draper n=1 Tax=Holothuria leucospilota TaxID=206669 RepID=A0A9Q1CIB3_HOLLE|nr:Protein draper [Holothuria leucospilota]
MGYIHLLPAWSLIWLSLCIFSSIGDNDSHVCERLRLVKRSDVPLSSEAQICEELNYPEWICERIRPANIGLLEEIYSVQLEKVCCPGWLPSIESDGYDSEDEDEKELECKLPCKEGFFGQDCAFECRCIHGTSHNCNPVDGSCDCLDGWMGQDCDERCSPGFFGPNCHERSIFSCMNGGVNHPVTGHCLCEHGYGGSRCEIECGGMEHVTCGDVVCDNCIQNSTNRCDYIGGFCVCQSGWKGRYCSEPCDIGFEGDFCTDICCSGRGYCTGESCICADGYQGDECQNKCEDGTFGKNCEGQCLCPLSCNHMTGVCEECPPGFTGDRCTDYCSATKWGSSCNETCSCEGGKMCDIFTGECFSTDPIGLYLLAGSSGIVVLVALITSGVLCAVCRRRYKKRRSAEQNEQPYINSDMLPTGDSSRGYVTPFEMNSYTRNAMSPLYRNESVTSDGYLTPIHYYTINEAISETPTFNG